MYIFASIINNMAMKKILLLMLMSLPAMMQARTEFTQAVFDFSTPKDKGEVLAVTPQTTFDEERGYGYDFGRGWDGKSAAPFYFSVNVPDGNYRVTVTLGSKKRAGETTVRCESRRLFVWNEATAKGKTYSKTFVVNKRNTKYIDEKGNETAVKIKPREKTKLNWDDKLTFEFNGDAPCVQRIEIVKDDQVPTMFLCGNSTVVDQDNEPWASWGQMITYYLDDQIAVANYAESGETATSFRAAGRLAKIVSLMKEGDYIFMEFGHNDQKSDSKVGNGAFYSFQHELKYFVDYARQKGAQAVFCTPTRRRHFDDNNRIKDTHLDYPEAVIFMADREGLPYIDLQRDTKIMYEAWGPETSKHALVHYPAGTWPGQDKAFADDTHFNPFGAMQIAKLVLKGIQEKVPALAGHVLSAFDGIDPAHPADWQSFKWANAVNSEVEKPDGN